MSPKTTVILLSAGAGANLTNACDIAIRPPTGASWWLIALAVVGGAVSALLAVAVCERLRQLARTEVTKELRP